MVSRKMARVAPRPKERKGIAVTPTNTLRLMEAMGVTRAARELGTSTTTLHKARKSGIISKSLEVASGAILRDLAVPGDSVARDYEAVQHTAFRRTTTFMAEVAPEKAEMFEKMAEMLGAKVLRGG